MACGLVELGKVASSSAMLGFWLENRNVRSQVVGKVRRGGSTDLRLDLGRSEEHVTCHTSALAMTDDACWEAKM